MSGLLQKLSAKWDLITKRYELFYVSSRADEDECLEIMEAVRRDELNRVAKGQSALHTAAFEGRDIPYRLLACRDRRKGVITGCFKITRAALIKDIPACQQEYQLQHFSEEQLERLQIFTRLVSRKSYRKTIASFLLMIKGYRMMLEEGNLAVLFTCEPSLFPMYKKVGMQPLGAIQLSPSGAFRLPLICIPDMDYYQRIKSPAVPLMKGIDYSQYKDFQDWYYKLVARDENVGKGIALYHPKYHGSAAVDTLTAGLSKKGRADFLRNAIVFRCQKGDLILPEQDGGRTFGFVNSGSIRVIGRYGNVTSLESGDIFGEVSHILDMNRQARVVASSPNTEVVMMSMSAIKRLKRAKDEVALWKNMSKLLARRVLVTNYQAEQRLARSISIAPSVAAVQRV